MHPLQSHRPQASISQLPSPVKSSQPSSQSHVYPSARARPSPVRTFFTSSLSIVPHDRIRRPKLKNMGVPTDIKDRAKSKCKLSRKLCNLLLHLDLRWGLLWCYLSISSFCLPQPARNRRGIVMAGHTRSSPA